MRKKLLLNLQYPGSWLQVWSFSQILSPHDRFHNKLKPRVVFEIQVFENLGIEAMPGPKKKYTDQSRYIFYHKMCSFISNNLLYMLFVDSVILDHLRCASTICGSVYICNNREITNSDNVIFQLFFVSNAPY